MRSGAQKTDLMPEATVRGAASQRCRGSSYILGERKKSFLSEVLTFSYPQSRLNKRQEDANFLYFARRSKGKVDLGGHAPSYNSEFKECLVSLPFQSLLFPFLFSFLSYVLCFEKTFLGELQHTHLLPWRGAHSRQKYGFRQSPTW